MSEMSKEMDVRGLILFPVSNFKTIRSRALELFYLYTRLILISITHSRSWKWFWRNRICSSDRHAAAWPLVDSHLRNAFLQQEPSFAHAISKLFYGEQNIVRLVP